jgi:hypothetical protein
VKEEPRDRVTVERKRALCERLYDEAVQLNVDEKEKDERERKLEMRR